MLHFQTTQYLEGMKNGYISPAVIEEMTEILLENPLKPGEFRRIESLGSYYRSLEPKWGNSEALFVAKINGESIFVIRKNQ